MRCVRRAFLCGDDAHSGQSYEHRRQWVVDKLGQLSRLFAIGICAYAVMSNHYHLVLKVEPDTAANWSEREVAERWAALFQWPLLVRRWYQGEALIEPELAVVQQLLAVAANPDAPMFTGCRNFVMQNRDQLAACSGLHLTVTYWPIEQASSMAPINPTPPCSMPA